MLVIPLAFQELPIRCSGISKKIFHHDALPILIRLLLCLVPVQIVFWCRIEDVEETFSCITDFQHTGHVAASIAVVWCAPYSAQSVIIQYLVAFLAQLVRA